MSNWENSLNGTEKRNIVELYLISQALERVGANKKFNKEIGTALKYVNTYLIKAYEGIAHQFPKQAKSLWDEMNYHKMLVLPTAQAYDKLNKLIEERKSSPQDAMSDMANATMSMQCVGCTGKEHCEFRDVLVDYDIEPLDAEDPICKWRL